MIHPALRATALAVALSGCASVAPSPSATPVPARIGVAVQASEGRVQVDAVGAAARRAGLREGDIVVFYNGEAVRDARHFERLVLDSRPGSVATLDVLREGRRLLIRVDVLEIDTGPLA